MSVSDLIRRRAAAERAQQGYVYHGFSVRLPPAVHAIVHDQSLPEHVRGFHLARHLLTHQPGDEEIAHSGQMLGQDWHRDSHYASMEAQARGGISPGRTPYVLKALHPEPEHVISDDERKGHPMWVHAGSPVHFTSIFWNHPDGDGEGQLDFPEPVTGRA